MSLYTGQSSSPLRLALDALWVAGFAVSLIWLLAGARGGASQPAGAFVLELRPGLQQQALLRRGQRIGTVQLLTERRPRGWLLERRVEVGGRRVALIRQELRADLSLASLELSAELDSLSELAGLPGPLLRELGGLGALSVSGPCHLETGTCALVGRLGDRTLRFPVHPGRGPVLTAAVYPLLARGRLGRRLELSLFDPLALRPQRVTLSVVGHEALELADGRHQAVRVRTSLESGVTSEVWLDRDGMPLREELPLGFRIDHERWRLHE